MSNGYLPKKVTYVCSSPETIDVYDDEDICGKKIASHKVSPTFPVEDGKKLDAAIKWTGLKNPRMETLDNSPIKSIIVCNLEERGNGGRAYKVIVDNKFYVDMREDVILDTMINCGIEKGAILKGEYVWAKYGSNMKLVRVGSSLHAHFANGIDTSTVKELASSEIIVGGIYEMKSGVKRMYLGAFYTLEYKYSENWGYFVKVEDRYSNQRFVKQKVHAFLDVREHNYKKKIEDLSGSDLLKNKEIRAYYYDLKTSIPKFIRKVDQKDLSNFDVIKHLRDVGDKTGKDDKTGNDNPYPHNLYCSLINIAKSAEELEIHEKLKKFRIPIASK